MRLEKIKKEFFFFKQRYGTDKIIQLGIILFIVIVLPVSFFVVQKINDLRSKATGSTGSPIAYSKVEAEDSVIGNGVMIGDDANASGGKYIVFGANTDINIETGEMNRLSFASSSDEIPNPERGFMRQSNIFVDQAYEPAKIGKKDPNDTLDWVYFHLEKYRDPRDGKGITLSDYQFVPLEPVGSGRGLDTVKKTFDDARAKGLKLVIRFLYVGYSGIGSTTDLANAEPDAPLDIAQRHLDQLAPLIQQNKDVIAAVQAGFVGYWGEWHSSKYLNPVANRKAIVDKLLAVTPLDRMVQIRYPRFVQVLYGGPLADSQAFNQSNLSRVGFHNDAFLRDDVDGGTFRSSTGGVKISTYCDGYLTGENQCWRDYIAQSGRYTPVGGEAGTQSSTPSTFADCSNALTQLSNQYFSFLHNSYSMVTLDHWVNQGCMPEIRKRLGYRFELLDARLPASAKAGEKLGVLINLRNTGFAAMYNPRKVYLVLSSSNNRYEFALDQIDPRKWEAGKDSLLSISLDLPQNLVPGQYTLGLWLPDADDRLKNRPEFAVRFANRNIWNSENGLNILSTNFQLN